MHRENLYIKVNTANNQKSPLHADPQQTNFGALHTVGMGLDRDRLGL